MLKDGWSLWWPFPDNIDVQVLYVGLGVQETCVYELGHELPEVKNLLFFVNGIWRLLEQAYETFVNY